MAQQNRPNKRYSHGRAVYIVDGSRSPFLKVRGRPGPFSASDLAVQAAKPLLLRQPFAADRFDEVIVGCVGPAPEEANIARVVALRLGCGDHVPAWTVQRNCASGLQSIDSAYRNIASGHSDLVLTGGVEAMSHAPLLLGNAMVNWLADWRMAKTFGQRFDVLKRLRPAHLAPVVSLLKGLTDPVVGLSMGQTAEKLTYRFNLTRAQMDAYAVESHRRLHCAQASNTLREIEVIYDAQGHVYDCDDGVRPDTTIEKLAKLKPVFDKPFGDVTAGNSAQVTDGAAWLILASEEAIEAHQLPIMGRIVDTHWAALDPAQMGLGPVHAVVPMLKRSKLSPRDTDYWEINEAFAAQVLACLAAWKDEQYCRSMLGLDRAFGDISPDRLNIDGGGISLGHPVGASGSRIVLHLLHVLKRNTARRGVATLCIGGGQGGAMLVENVTS
jgi:acetyl-CoA C-acetyltransferase